MGFGGNFLGKLRNPNMTFDDLISMNREQLLNLHLPDALELLKNISDIEEVYSAKIAILVSMHYKTQAKTATFTEKDLEFLGPIDQVIESSTDGNLVFKHPTRDHCILVDMIDSRYSSFGTLRFSDLEVSTEQDKTDKIVTEQDKTRRIRQEKT